MLFTISQVKRTVSFLIDKLQLMWDLDLQESKENATSPKATSRQRKSKMTIGGGSSHKLGGSQALPKLGAAPAPEPSPSNLDVKILEQQRTLQQNEFDQQQVTYQQQMMQKQLDEQRKTLQEQINSQQVQQQRVLQEQTDQQPTMDHQQRQLRGSMGGGGICYGFRDEGRCKFGDDCKFQHISSGRSTPAPPRAGLWPQ